MSKANNVLRLNKYLSEAGVCSRREADKLIGQGRVCVDGRPGLLGMVIEPGQEVKVDGKVVCLSTKTIVLAINKPAGVVCTEDKGEPNNIIDFLNYPIRVTYAGRLDKESRGLLLMTNSGDLINQIMRSRHNHEKEYKVVVDKEITDDFLKKMRAGVAILNTVTKPCKVDKIDKYSFRIVLTQGLNRQIRRMCEALGYQVRDLVRIRIINITLEGLMEGKWRELSEQEISDLGIPF